MKRYKLAVEKRKVTGKKVKKLRKEGIFPANIYGKDVKSLAVQVPYKEFEKVYKEAGVTGIVDVSVDGEIRPSLIHNVQQDYYKHTLLHADFFQVNLKEKVKTTVKIIVIGEAKAVSFLHNVWSAAILDADEVKITDRGLEITMTKPQHDEKKQEMPHTLEV